MSELFEHLQYITLSVLVWIQIWKCHGWPLLEWSPWGPVPVSRGWELLWRGNQSQRPEMLPWMKWRRWVLSGLLLWLRYYCNNWATSWQNQQNDCAPSEDSDPPSLIRVFTVCMKKHWVLSYPLSAQQRLWLDGWMPRLIWVFAGCTVILLVFVMRWLV